MIDKQPSDHYEPSLHIKKMSSVDKHSEQLLLETNSNSSLSPATRKRTLVEKRNSQKVHDMLLKGDGLAEFF